MCSAETLLVAILIMVLAGSGCTSGKTGTAASPEPARNTPSVSSSPSPIAPSVAPVDLWFAIVRPGAFSVVHDTKITKSVKGHFDVRGTYWTQDGRFALATPSLDSGEQWLTVIEAATGKVRKIDCEGCNAIAAVGNAKILIATYSGKLLRLDLDVQQNPVALKTGLPQTEGRLELIGEVPNQAVVYLHAVAAPDSKKQLLYYISWDGATQNSAYPSAKVPGPAIYARRTAYQGPRLAFAVTPWDVPCQRTDDVWLVDPATGQATVTDASAAGPPLASGSGAAGGLGVQGLWWAADGSLHAMMQSWRCDKSKSPPEQPVDKRGDWRLDGNRWTRVGDIRSYVVLSAADGTLVSIDEKNAVNVVRGGRSTKVDASSDGASVSIAPDVS